MEPYFTPHPVNVRGAPGTGYRKDPLTPLRPHTTLREWVPAWRELRNGGRAITAAISIAFGVLTASVSFMSLRKHVHFPIRIKSRVEDWWSIT